MMRWWPQLPPLNSCGMCAGPPVLSHLPWPQLAAKTQSVPGSACLRRLPCAQAREAGCVPKLWAQTRKLLWPFEKGGRPLPVCSTVCCRGPRQACQGPPWLLCLPGGLTYVAVVHPDAVAVIAGPALHDVVGVVRLRNLVVGVNDNLGGSQVRLAAESCLCQPPPEAQGPARPSPASNAPRLAETALARPEVREAGVRRPCTAVCPSGIHPNLHQRQPSGRALLSWLPWEASSQ